MRKPDPQRRPGFQGTSDGSRNIRHEPDTYDALMPGDQSALLYGPTIRDRTGEVIQPEPPPIAPFTAKPALSLKEIRRRKAEREARRAAVREAAPYTPPPVDKVDAIRRAAERLEAAVRAEVERGGDGR